MPHHVRNIHIEVAAPTPSNTDFRFSVELGLVVRSLRFNHKEFASLAGEISHVFNKAGITNHVARPAAHKHEENWRDWTIISDLGIPSKPHDHKFGVKLVSPILKFTHVNEWNTEIRLVWQVLKDHFAVTTLPQCTTTVNLVAPRGRWTLGQAKRLATGALYFEKCIDALVPAAQRRSIFAKSNRWNSYFNTLPMEEAFARVDAQPSVEALAARMCRVARGSPTAWVLGENHADYFVHDTFRWDFSSLQAAKAGEGLGTVAFRQAPGCTSAGDTLAWVSFVVCFARLSCTFAHTLRADRPAKLRGLAEWIIYEAKYVGVHSATRARLDSMFLEAVPLPKGPVFEALSVTVDEDHRLRWREAERNVTAEKYKKYLRDRVL